MTKAGRPQYGIGVQISNGGMLRDNVSAAAQWLADQQEQPILVLQTLRREYSLTAKETCEACALAQQFRSSRRVGV
jgi:hypothetical protein